MPSKISAIPRREPYKVSAVAATTAKPMQQSQPTSLGRKTRLPMPSHLTSTTTTKASSKKHQHTRIVATPSNKTTQAPRPRSTPSSSKAKDTPSIVKVTKDETSGLLTPPLSTLESPRQPVPECFASPKAPKKEDGNAEAPKIVTRLETPTSPTKSPYMHAHIGDPCIPGALVHQLSCGHKVITRIPEQCKANCQRPLPECIAKFANAKHQSHAFVCGACVEQHVEKHRQNKRALFLETFDKTKLQMGCFPEGWIESQMEYWERVWENDMQKERAEFAKLGEICTSIPGEPVPVELAPAVNVGKSTFLPLAPEKKSKKVTASPGTRRGKT
ncbi:hypothetical protein PRZ48_003704 [Zasmidium cellare]|uniref:Uncharacterized protein n=1 Tax=Zasmidium cellare TaxID=395010 RepID=A0ABR0EWK7_ZASCE|nr:hypothetical protein PRZ48_003704 [Zasmidium cellare]